MGRQSRFKNPMFRDGMKTQVYHILVHILNEGRGMYPGVFGNSSITVWAMQGA